MLISKTQFISCHCYINDRDTETDSPKKQKREKRKRGKSTVPREDQADRGTVCVEDRKRKRSWYRESKSACATGAHLARKLLSCFFGTVVDISVGGLIPAAVVSATRPIANGESHKVGIPSNSYEIPQSIAVLRASSFEPLATSL